MCSIVYICPSCACVVYIYIFPPCKCIIYKSSHIHISQECCTVIYIYVHPVIASYIYTFPPCNSIVYRLSHAYPSWIMYCNMYHTWFLIWYILLHRIHEWCVCVWWMFIMSYDDSCTQKYQILPRATAKSRTDIHALFSLILSDFEAEDLENPWHFAVLYINERGCFVLMRFI